MSAAQVLHDTTVVTGDEAGTILYDAALLIERGRIAAAGPSAQILAQRPDAERVDARGCAVLPGFANTHTHLPRVLARGIYEDLSPPHEPPFTGGLAPLPLPKTSPEEDRVLALLGALEAIRSGTTLLLEEGHGLDVYAGALADTGLRLVLCERAWDRAKASIGQPGPFEVDAALGEAGVARIGAFHARWHGAAEARVQTGLAAWAPDMASPELLGRLRKLQDELGVLASIHLNQVWGEVAAVREQRGVLPTEYLARTGFLSDRLVAAHCRCMTADEERTLGASRAAVAINSCIAARRGLAANIDELERAGCRITLGTDNMAEDMVEVTRTAMFMERVRRTDGRRPTPEAALGWATRNGYRALGVPDGGWLTAGNRADLVVVDLRRAHLTPALRVVSDFIHNGQAADVRSVMVDGRWLMRDHRVITLDETAIVAEADRIARAAWGRLFAERPDLTRPAGLDTRSTP
ncbi:MAG TPA: amidohydrolase family protein [Methylomirabilota bacterium]|nr:amidohydrolase family protein [Methylomirabilota bacterium]